MANARRVPIRFKTLVDAVFPMSVMVVSLPPGGPQLPPRMIQPLSQAATPVVVNAPAPTVYQTPPAPANPAAFQPIILQYGLGGPIILNLPTTPNVYGNYQAPPLPLQAIQTLALGGPFIPPTANAPPIQLYPLPIFEYFKKYGPLDVIFTKPVAPTPPPGLEVTVKTMQVTLGIAGTTVTLAHGLHSVPRLIIATISGRTDLTDNSGRINNKRGYGICANPAGVGLQQFCVGTHSEDNTTFTQAGTTVRNDAIVSAMATGTSEVTQGKLAVQSIDATNITFIINEAFGANYVAEFQIFAGTDFTNISLAAYNAPLAAGLQDITTLGFKPDFLMFIGGHLSQSLPDVENDSSGFIGACDANLNQWTWSAGVNDAGGGGAGGSGRGRSYMRAGDAICVLGSAVDPPNAIASVNALLVNGVELNWTVLNLASGQTKGRTFVMLAIQGANWAVGNFLTQLDTNEHQVASGLPFTPDGEIFVSACKPASTFNTLDINDQWSMGLSQDYSVNTAQATFGKDRQSPTQQGASIAFASDYVETDMTGAVLAKFGVSSRQSNGFSIKHSVAGATQNFVGYIAFSHIVQGPYQTIIKTVKPLGGGDYLDLNTAIQSELAFHKNLISQNIVLEFDCYAGINTNPVTIPGVNNSGGNGYITDPTHYIYVNVIQGHSGLPKTDGSVYLLDVTSTTVDPLLIRCEYVKFRQMQIRHNVDSVATSLTTYHVGTTGMLAPTRWDFVNCIAIANFTNGGAANGFIPAGATFDVAGVTAFYINCIAYHYLSRDTTITGFNTGLAVNQSIRLYNCTAYDCNQGFQDHADVIHINCAAIGCDNGWNTSTGPNASSDYNFSTCGPPAVNGVYLVGTNNTEAIDAKGPHSLGGFGCLMVDPLHDDIRPDGGDTSVSNHGLNLSVDPFYPFNFDVAGNPRAAGVWTIGAFENTRPIVQRVMWAWAGGADDQYTTLAIKMLLAELNVFVLLSTNPTMAGAQVFGPSATNGNNVAVFKVPIIPNTKYYYQVQIAALPVGPIYSFTALPKINQPSNFSFVCGGCSDAGSNTNAYLAEMSLGALMMIEYGDLHYYNINTNNILLYRQALDSVLLAPKRGAMFGSMLADWMYDDHDYADDNSDGTSPARPASQAAYRESFPAYPLGAISGAIYHSFVIGRCRFIITDLRSDRDSKANADSPTHTQMSAEQYTWFTGQLQLAKQLSQLVFWFTTVPWIAPPGDNSGDNWGGHTFERRKVSDFIEQLGWPNIVIMAGDMHSAAIDDGTNDVYNTDGSGNHLVNFLPFPQNQTTQIYNGLYTQGPIVHSATRLMGFFGEVKIADDSQHITVTFNVRNELGVQMTFQRSYFVPVIVWPPEIPVGEVYTGERPTAVTFKSETPTGLRVTPETPSGKTFKPEVPSGVTYVPRDGTKGS